MKPRFHITYDVVTEDSASHGEAAYRGFLPKSGDVPRRNNMPKRPSKFTLRQAFDMMDGHYVHAESYPCRVPRWLTISKTEREEGTSAFYRYGPGFGINLSLHVDSVSDASARRIARLFGCRLTP